MIHKGQWVVLPAAVAANHLPELRLSPPGVIPQRDRRPRWIGDYSFSEVNKDTLDIAPSEAMQFGHAFARLLREILLANPAFGAVLLAKGDLSDGFYRVDLAPEDAAKLSLVFPVRPGSSEYLVAVPLVLPMGWQNSPPYFSAVTETIADITNTNLGNPSYIPESHPLDELAAELDDTPTADEDRLPALLPREPCSTPSAVAAPVVRDPSLPFPSTPLQYTDVYVDDFIPAAQRPFLRRTRRALLHAIDLLFRPLDRFDNPARREPVSLKKLRQGDFSWSTIKTVLGWVVDTVSMTIHLPPHRVTRLWEILDSIPRHQRRTSVRKWYKVLGELRSTSVALPGSRNTFSQLQQGLRSKGGGRINLTKGTHQALDDFRWIARDLTSRPTRIVPSLLWRRGIMMPRVHRAQVASGFRATMLSCGRVTPRRFLLYGGYRGPSISSTRWLLTTIPRALLRTLISNWPGVSSILIVGLRHWTFESELSSARATT